MNSELSRLVEQFEDSSRRLGYDRGRFHHPFTKDAQDAIDQDIRYLDADRAKLATYMDRQRPALQFETLNEIEQRVEAATPGPWAWFGNYDTQDYYLGTQHSGRIYVMGFKRCGMQSAQPAFRKEVDGSKLGHITPGSELAIFEVAPDALGRTDPHHNVYRGQITGFRSPDAVFIANARADAEMLIARIRDLERQIAFLTSKG